MLNKHSFFLLIFPSLILASFLIFFILFFSGCYTLKQGTTMLGYLGKAIPLEDLAKLNGSEDAAFARRVADIRRFATEELGLKPSKNYTRYVELDRDYLAAVVSACAADSFTRYEWRFPVVGAVPYKGFFNPKDAQKEAAKLKADGFDILIRPVDAFSTLGWFRDPLYSYMKKYTDYQLADLIIHELLHATAFVKGKVEFNEQLAEFAGTEGARLYIKSRFREDSPEYLSIGSGEDDYRAYREFLFELCAELEILYSKKDINRELKLAEKEKIIANAKERFDAEYQNRFKSDRYRFFSGIPVNNAYLDLYRLYHEKDNFFDDLFNTIPGDDMSKLRSLIEAAASLNESREAQKDPRTALMSILRCKL
jgi:predicted aminopeptidase